MPLYFTWIYYIIVDKHSALFTCNTLVEKNSLKWKKRFLSSIGREHRKRTGALLLRDILIAAEKGANKTHIMFASNMNPTVLNRYLQFALKYGLLEQRARTYYTTDKGVEFLHALKKLEELMNDIYQVEQELSKLIE
ncbi:MAG: winged helix-turn-helix domain-containing protein [Thermoprotei archaeon]